MVTPTALNFLSRLFASNEDSDADPRIQRWASYGIHLKRGNGYIYVEGVPEIQYQTIDDAEPHIELEIAYWNCW